MLFLELPFVRYGQGFFVVCYCSGYNKLVDFYLGEFGHVLVESDYTSSGQCFGSVIIISGIWVNSKDSDEDVLDSIPISGGVWYDSRHGVA